jgi:serine/threonine protein kinase
LSGSNSSRNLSFKDINYYGESTSKLGKGAFGSVYQRTKENVCVAVKVFETNENGLSIDAIRELTILSSISHPNVIKLIDISPVGDGFTAVLECASRNLNSYMNEKSKDSTKMDPILNRKWMYELSRGLHFLHQNNIWHRDLKPHNLLILSDNRIVIADFGAARFDVIPGGKYTGGITTALWRPPEILLGMTQYGAEVDVFSLGTIFIELYYHTYIFGANNEDDILLRQMSILGHMTEEYWPEMSKYYLYQKYKKFAMTRVNGKFDEVLQPYMEYLHDDGLLLLKNMTYPNPANRIKMDEVIQSSFFDPIKDNINYPFIETRCGDNLKLLQKPYIRLDLNFTPLYELLIDLVQFFKLKWQTFFHAKILLDRVINYNSTSDINFMETLTIGCFSISNLIFDVIPVHISDYSVYSEMESSKTQTVISEKNIRETVTKILTIIEFDLNYPTVDQFIYYYINPSSKKESDKKESDKKESDKTLSVKTFSPLENIKPSTNFDKAIELGVAYTSLSQDKVTEYLSPDMVAQICSYVILTINSVEGLKFNEFDCLTFNDLERAKIFMLDLEKVNNYVEAQLPTIRNTINSWNKIQSRNNTRSNKRKISSENMLTPTEIKIQKEDIDGINIKKDITINITNANKEDVTREDLSNFIKELLINIAVYNANNIMMPYIEEYAKYFKLEYNGSYIPTTYDLNRIVLSFGPLNVLTQVTVTFMYVPPEIENDIYKLLLTTNYKHSNDIMTGRISKFNISRKA